MKVRLPDGNVVEVGNDALYNDDDTPFTPTLSQAATGQTFTADDLARVRQEEKDKLYGKIDTLTQELNGFKEQVGSLTAAEQRRQAQAEEEKTRLEAEARKREEEDLDAKSLLQRREQEWQQQIQGLEQTWEQKFQQAEQEREQALALAQKEREFADLREHIAAQVEANKDKIAPQLLGWITGNSREEVDAAVARAIETTDAILADIQQSQPGAVPPGVAVQPGAQPTPPVLPGTRAVGGPANVDVNAQYGTQQLTPEQIANMDMAQYANLRKQMGIGGQNNNRGLFG